MRNTRKNNLNIYKQNMFNINIKRDINKYEYGELNKCIFSHKQNKNIQHKLQHKLQHKNQHKHKQQNIYYICIVI